MSLTNPIITGISMETPDWSLREVLHSTLDIARTIGTALVDRTTDLVMDAAEAIDRHFADSLPDTPEPPQADK